MLKYIATIHPQFVLLMSEAILMYSPMSSLAISSDRADKTRWHWVLQACAVASAYTGLAIITCNKYLNGYPHYTSWHGSIGIFQCGMIALQVSGGILEQFPDILPFKVRLVLLKRMHAFFGMLTFFGGPHHCDSWALLQLVCGQCAQPLVEGLL